MLNRGSESLLVPLVPEPDPDPVVPEDKLVPVDEGLSLFCIVKTPGLTMSTLEAAGNFLKSYPTSSGLILVNPVRGDDWLHGQVSWTCRTGSSH